MDMWSLGSTIYELYTRSPLFSDEQEATTQLLRAYETGHLDLSVNRIADTQARHVLHKLLVVDPRKRVSVEEVLRSAYLTGGADTAQVCIFLSISFVCCKQTFVTCFLIFDDLLLLRFPTCDQSPPKKSSIH
jgi:serine/threonine protein kinase